MTIMLIAGHGGSPYDPGATGNGYTEAVETRRMANAVAPLLRNYGFNVVMYDQSNDAYKIVTRGGSLPLSGVNYVIEFHLNAAAGDYAGNGVTTGSEIWVHTNESGITVEQAILKRIAALGFKNRGVKRSSGLAVLKHVHNHGISHALIETCFVDDKDDMNLYGEKFNQIAKAIADGVAEGFGVSVKDSTEEDDDMITQEQFNQMMDNYLENLAKQEPDAWSQEHRDWAESAGLIKGDENGDKQYKSFCTREQMVTFMHRLFEMK